MYALTNSLATFELLSARDAIKVLKSKVSSVSGRTVTPFLANRNAPTFTKNAKDDPSATDGNASSGAITCLTRVGRIPRASAPRIIVS